MKEEKLEILLPINQMKLFGYEELFSNFSNLFNKKKLPNTILLSGPKGSGKSTFCHHFINYILSNDEKTSYSLKNYSIKPDSKTYINIRDNTHPNFFYLKNTSGNENIKINEVRNLLNFLKKTTYSSNIKLVLIDNAEFLNPNASNALLKVLEEPSSNTFFFIIFNNSFKILNTIKSRCVEFKIFFSHSEKKKIFTNIIEQYTNNFDSSKFDKIFYIDTPGNILDYFLTFLDKEIDVSTEHFSSIIYLIDKYKKKTDPKLLNFISFFVELFYSNLSLENNKHLSTYFNNRNKILRQINEAKKFNLDKKNLFINLENTLQNDL